MSERTKATPIVRIDDDGRVKATEWAFAPGAETGWHRHEYDYVVVPLTDGRVLIELPDGSTADSAMTAGIPYARRFGVEHNVVNAGSDVLRFLEVEITG
jgi:beta-alanine degradation protein BauB